MDQATRRSLEIIEPMFAGSPLKRSTTQKRSLLEVLDLSTSSMGARLLAAYLASPLTDIDAINQRLDAVEFFHGSSDLLTRVRRCIRGCPDMERCLQRVALGRGGPRDIDAIRQSLRVSSSLYELVYPELTTSSLLSSAISACSPTLTQSILTSIDECIVDDPPLSIEEGGFIREGYDEDLDDTRALRDNGRAQIRVLQQRYRDELSIKALHIRYRRIDGYSIEVSKSNQDKVPSSFMLCRDLKTSLRFKSPELRNLESLIASSAARALQLERDVFEKLCQSVLSSSCCLLGCGSAVASIDVFSALAKVALDSSYVRPLVNASADLIIEGGRHAIVESGGVGGADDTVRMQFIENSCDVRALSNRATLLTGPNMAGKSVYLRQNALIAIMAQIGSFVPARSAIVGVVDKMFSRVGSVDDISRDRSSFMVEMLEMAAILKHATPRSFVIADEVGRGSSPWDGMCIAVACLEHMYWRNRCRVLFATHFHEMAYMAESLPGLSLRTMAVQTSSSSVDPIVFLHKVVDGSIDNSYGVNVARIAGVPKEVGDRAEALLEAVDDLRMQYKATLASQIPALTGDRSRIE